MTNPSKSLVPLNCIIAQCKFSLPVLAMLCDKHVKNNPHATSKMVHLLSLVQAECVKLWQQEQIDCTILQLFMTLTISLKIFLILTPSRFSRGLPQDKGILCMWYSDLSWWHHDMEMLSALLVLCVCVCVCVWGGGGGGGGGGRSNITSGFPSQRASNADCFLCC